MSPTSFTTQLNTMPHSLHCSLQKLYISSIFSRSLKSSSLNLFIGVLKMKFFIYDLAG